MMINEKTTRTLTDLLTLNHTSQEGYETAAEQVNDVTVKSQLSEFAQQRAQFINALQGYGQPAADTSTTVEGALTEGAAAIHRGWINLKAMVMGEDNTAAVLEACETGEATALKAYETALTVEGLPQELKAVLQEQHGQILQAKNQVTALKAGQ